MCRTIFSMTKLFVKCWWNWHQGSIWSTFYEQLLLRQIPKAQKRQSGQQCRFTLLEPTSVKALPKMFMKLAPGVNFINILWATFTCADPKNVKKTVWSAMSFYAFGTYEHKSFAQNVHEIDTCIHVNQNVAFVFGQATILHHFELVMIVFTPAKCPCILWYLLVLMLVIK